MKKRACLRLGAGLVFLCAVAVPGQAQQPPAATAAPVVVTGEPAAPLMLVYVAKTDDNVLPRIALGIEQPAAKVAALEKCVRVAPSNPKLAALAVQLKAEDTKEVIAAIKALGAPDARELPDVVVWFTTPENKVLDYVTTRGTNIETNLVKGVLMFDLTSEGHVAGYLVAKLHPE